MMKKFKLIFIPIGIIATVLALFSFTQNIEGGDKKCKVKIVKIIDGVRTEVDSTFDCKDHLNWIESLHTSIGVEGDSLHKVVRIMMMGDDTNEFNFDMNMDYEGEDMKIMKLSTGDGEEDVEMNFDIKMLDGEDGKIKMMINGEEMEIALDEMHQHLKKLHENIEVTHDNAEDVEVIIEDIEGGSAPHTVKIIKKKDDDGNVTIKKIVNGEEVELDEADIHEIHGEKMMFIGGDKDHEMTIDVKVDGKNGVVTKHVVVIANITSESVDELAKKIPAAEENLKKKELNVDDLTFSPNPNDGKFDLNFKLNKKAPVHIRIFDMNGKEVYSENISNFSGQYQNNIDISENEKGMYLLQIIQKDRASTSKLVIK